jgi:hypothetical protein
VPGVTKSRPAETAAASTGTVVGAVFLILAGYGVNVPPAVPAAVVVVVGWLSGLITAWVNSRRKRAK